MGILSELVKKPWLAEQTVGNGLPDHLHDQGAFFLPAGKVGLRVFLVVVTVVLTLLVIGYADRMTYSTWRSMPEPWILWLNTVVLILSSAALQWARTNAGRDRIDGVKSGLYLSGVLTLVFLLGQLVAWRQLYGLGYFAAANSANAFFYLLTALHGLHLFGGLVALGRSTARMWRGAAAVDLRLSVELCAAYWDYLLLVWLILFGLLIFS